MPSLPESIRCFGRTLSINVTDEGLNADEGEQGWFLPDSLEIVLKPGMAPGAIRLTALHEVFHDLDYCCGTQLGEKGVSSLSSAFFAVLRDNPAFVSWLTQESPQ